MRKYVGRSKREIFEVPEVMVPQVTEPGTEAEVDSFEALIRMAGVEKVVLFFQMRACFSGRVFVRAVARATQQAFLECTAGGFAYFGGVFHEVRMDNHPLAVERIMRQSSGDR